MKKLFLLLIASALSAADVTINSLPAISTVTSSTVLPVVDVAGTPTTKKATVSQLMTGLPAATSTTVGTMSAADKLKLDNATNANTASAIVQRDASGNFSAGTVTAAVVTGLAPPTNGTDAANKTYVDASAAGLTIKNPARAATVATVTLAGGAPATLDGLSLVLNDRIVVKDQSSPAENGIYYVSTLGTGSNGTWTRTTDADATGEVAVGTYCFVTSGTANANAAFTISTAPATIGVNALYWSLFSQTTQIQASNILGQIVAAQVADAAINTAKFAAGLRPVELLGTLPTTGNTAGRMVFLTSDSKLYRYTGSAFTAMIPATDLSTQITTTQITDNAITSPKVNALAITANKIAIGAVTAGKIDALAVTAGTIAAGAVTATEIATGTITANEIATNAITADKIVTNAITGAKILAGTITTDKITAATLSAISANLGTVTAGSLTANASVSVSSGISAVLINSSGLTVGGGRIIMTGEGGNPAIRVNGTGSYSGDYMILNGQAGIIPPFLQAVQAGVSSVTISPSGGLSVQNDKNIAVATGSTIVGPGDINMNAESSSKINVAAGETNSLAGYSTLIYWRVWINGREARIPMYVAP